MTNRGPDRQRPPVGSSFPYSQFLPEWDQGRGVQIDIDGRMVGGAMIRETIKKQVERLQV